MGIPNENAIHYIQYMCRTKYIYTRIRPIVNCGQCEQVVFEDHVSVSARCDWIDLQIYIDLIGCLIAHEYVHYVAYSFLYLVCKYMYMYVGNL